MSTLFDSVVLRLNVRVTVGVDHLGFRLLDRGLPGGTPGRRPVCCLDTHRCGQEFGGRPWGRRSVQGNGESGLSCKGGDH